MNEHKLKQASGYRLVIGYLGIITIFIGFIMLLPLLALIFYPNESKYALNFVIPGLVAILLGFGGYSCIRKREKGRLLLHHDAIIVTFSWLLAIFFSSFPIYLLGEYTFSESFFEMTSGWTTTGFTIVNFNTIPHIYLLFRSITHLFGGVGLILVMISALSDTFGMKLYNAEGHYDKLMPNLAKSTQMIFTIYIAFIGVGTILYRIFGMSWFDGLNHAISSVSTGGFSTKADGIMAFEIILSPANFTAIQIITIILMLLGSINFFAHLMIFRGKFKRFLDYHENKTYFVILVTLIALMAFASIKTLNLDFSEGFIASLFTLVSTITTTGFSVFPSLTSLSGLIIFILIIAMFIGGESGSTSGGVKIERVDIIFRSFYYSIRNRFVASKNIKRFDYVHKVSGKRVVDETTFIDISVFVFLFLLIITVSTIIFSNYGYGFTESFFDSLASVSNTGLSSGIIVNGVSPVILWTSTIGMLLGRLEIFVILIAFIKLSKDAYHVIRKPKRA